LFRQKDPKPFPPVCGPKGVPPPTPRIRGRENSLRSDSSRQEVDSWLRLRRIRRRDSKRMKDLKKDHQLLWLDILPQTLWLLSPGTTLTFLCPPFICVGRGWVAGQNPTSWRGLFERKGSFAPCSEFPRHPDSGW